MADSDGCQRLGPEIADFEDEGQLAGERDPPAGESDEELGRRCDDDIRTRNVMPRRAAETQNEA